MKTGDTAHETPKTCNRCGGRGTVLITWPTTSCREDDRAICGRCHGSGKEPGQMCGPAQKCLICS